MVSQHLLDASIRRLNVFSASSCKLMPLILYILSTCTRGDCFVQEKTGSVPQPPSPWPAHRITSNHANVDLALLLHELWFMRSLP